ncbi:MAG: phosphate ABC transporter permease PstA [Oscillospiraceae bacterium]|jgi:phosphate transport system permease protein|nr:phosphate ABC transporter permease PstA [Oscillospiraceae bacterium]
MKRAKRTERLLSVLTWGAAALTGAVLLFLVGFILYKGVPHLKPSLFALRYTSENVSLLPALISTVIMALLSLLIAVPLSVGAAVYLVEYARRGNKLVRLVRITAETLAGIPSIIYGLFGMLFFGAFLGWGFSLLAGACTLAMMILPTVLRAGEEALMAVPDLWREGAFGLGAGRLRVVFRIVLPAAAPGLFAGVLLAVGRIVGETAALIYTAGTVAQIPTDIWMSARTLSVHLYALSSEGLRTNEGYATAVVLLLLVALINAASHWAAQRIGRKSAQ